VVRSFRVSLFFDVFTSELVSLLTQLFVI